MLVVVVWPEFSTNSTFVRFDVAQIQTHHRFALLQTRGDFGRRIGGFTGALAQRDFALLDAVIVQDIDIAPLVLV